VTLDTREGEVADLAVLPDGRVWVAMNVRKPGDPSPQPRIALFDAAGKFAGVEAFGDFGQVVRASRPTGRRLLRGGLCLRGQGPRHRLLADHRRGRADLG
jgi:hypothetical protein